ncbi:MAG: hypothetical protein AMJ94_12860 [Deltaproteobacteria bacterium SM23_61]|nr:MAG: hypothetical protein AMJ94_12860 [Deltaproteobacteria bacterium SM23_61]
MRVRTKAICFFNREVYPYRLRARHRRNPDFLIAQCRDRLPKYMIPRHLESVAQLPKTASEKVQKVALKAREIGSSWDRLEGK